MANSVAVASDSGTGEDIGLRLSRLNLPPRPLIMDKSSRQCPTHAQGPCFCYEYTTLLDRPEYAGKYLRDSPEPEVKVKKPANGTTIKKKLKLDQYLAGRGKSERRSAERSPNKPSEDTPTTKNHNNNTPKPTTTSAPKPTLESSTPAVATSNGRSPVKAPPKSVPAKRPPEPSSVVKSSQSSAKLSTPGPLSRPVKRQRTPSPPPQPRPRKSKLPPPPITTPSLPMLPALLSPTLPKVIEDALALEDKAKGRGAAPLKSNAGGPKSTKSVPVASGKKLPASSSTTSSGNSPHPGATAASPSKTVPKKSSALGSSSTASKGIGKLQASSPKLPPNATSKPDLRIIKIKFKKRRREFAQLVRLDPPPSKRPRPSQDDDTSERSVKRQKVPGALNAAKVSSARSPAFKSPAVKTSREKEIVSTPPQKKVNGTAALKRNELSGPAITPQPNRDKDRDPDRYSTGKGAKSGKTLATQFMEEHTRLSEEGKAAKHEADAIFRGVTSSNEDLKRALAGSVDSVMCFVLSFLLVDRQRQVENRTFNVEIWRSLVPLSSFASKTAKSLNEMTMYGFCKQLEAVVRQHIYDVDILVFGKTPLPDNQSKAPTPDSNNASSVPDRGHYQTLKTRLVRDSQGLRECWLDGLKHLRYDSFDTEFPRTYAARATKWIDPTNVYPKEVGRYKHGFQLPLHRNSTPQEALNFGRKFLDEWAAQNGVRYKSRLNAWLGD